MYSMVRTQICEYVRIVALIMPMPGAMNTSVRLIRSLIIICSITVAASAAAQDASDDPQPPTISRACLWNADNTTWRSLGLKHAQINQMNELRKLFPAVVDGQWVVSNDDMAPAPVERVGAEPNISTSVSGPKGIVAASQTVDQPNTQTTTTRPVGLQDRLRQVLDPAQMQRWYDQCSH